MKNRLLALLQSGRRRIQGAVHGFINPACEPGPLPLPDSVPPPIRLPPPVATLISPPAPVVRTPLAEKSLDNGPWFKLMEDSAALLGEVDDSIVRMQEEQKPFACHIQDRLFEILERNGAKEIAEMSVFDISRHKAVPAGRVPAGTPIVEVVQPGLAIEEKVIRRAWVKVNGPDRQG